MGWIHVSRIPGGVGLRGGRARGSRAAAWPWRSRWSGRKPDGEGEASLNPIINLRCRAVRGRRRPEYAYMRKVNEKVDVYSFGVVLLELTTGNKANAGGELGCLAEWARHHHQSGAGILDVIDTSIRYAGYHSEIETVFRLGVQCTGVLPSSRPAMKDVLQILLKCSKQTLRKSRMEGSMEFVAAPFLLP